MILAEWKGRWFRAHQASDSRTTCSLEANDREDLSALGFIREERSFGKPGDADYEPHYCWLRQMNGLEGIKFYPELKYRGIRVYPEYWRLDSAEPVLVCRMMGWDAQAAGFTQEQQIEDGWKGVGSGNGATKFLHVDKLEKIEGPPPEGGF